MRNFFEVYYNVLETFSNSIFLLSLLSQEQTQELRQKMYQH